MAKTLNLIIVDDAALVMPLTERLGFSMAISLPVIGTACPDDTLSRMLREARANAQLTGDVLYYLVVNTDTIMTARGIGGHHHTQVAFEAASLPRNLDVEFDRIMLATGYERVVVKERHSHFEGWHKHQNEPVRIPLPEGGYVMANDEDPNTAHLLRPRGNLTMKAEYISTPKLPIMPSAVLDTINKYLDEVKDKSVTPFDNVEIEGSEDDQVLTVTFTTRDSVMKDLLLKAGAVVVPDINNNDVAESYPLGRGLTPEATQQLLVEQNPHMYAEIPTPSSPQAYVDMWDAMDNSPGGASLYKNITAQGSLDRLKHGEE